MPRATPGVRHGGRQKGTGNKVSADIKALAQAFGPASIARLAELAGLIAGKRPAESEQTQVAAMKELLDRGYGKPAQAIVGGDEDSVPIALTFRWAEQPADEPEPEPEPDDAADAEP